MKKTLIFSGAGISKSAGIPTFNENPYLRDVFSLEYFEEKYEDFWNKTKLVKENAEKAHPTLAHKIIAAKDLKVVTMNIDGLHQMAGSKDVIEVHGNLKEIQCIKCGKKYNFKYINENLYCGDCAGKLKPHIALYGEQVPAYSEACRALAMYVGGTVLVIGTSFATQFAEEFVNLAKKYMCAVKVMNTDADEEVLEYFMDTESYF